MSQNTRRSGPPPPGLSMTKLEPPGSNNPSPRSGNPAPNHLQIPSPSNHFVPDSQFFNSPIDMKDFSDLRANGTEGDFGPHMAVSPPDGGSSAHGVGEHTNGIRSPGANDGDRLPPSTGNTMEDDGPMTSSDTANYPGVVMGTAGTGLGFDDIKLDDDNMAGILDPAAATTSHQGKAAGANVAPWLMEDEPPSPSTSKHPSGSQSPAGSSAMSTASGSASISNLDGPKKSHTLPHPHLPRFLRRHDEDDAASTRGRDSAAASLRSSSQTSLLPDGAKTPTSNRPKSIRDPSPQRGPPTRTASLAPAYNQPPQRFARFGSMAPGMGSNPNLAQQEKKKGFLGGLLGKRRTGQSVSAASWAPPEHQTGRGVSRMSMTTGPSGRNASISSTKSAPSGYNRQTSFKSSDGNVSPLHEESEPEPTEPEIKLDMDLGDMEGIVDPNLARQTVASSQSSVSPSVAGEMGLADALHHTSSFASGSSAPQGPTRQVIETNTGGGSFTRPNPFASPTSSQGSELPTMGTPPSPFTVLSNHQPLASASPGGPVGPGGPGASSGAATAPRRPSQLRNMKIGSIDSQNSDVSAMQPITPAWGHGMTPIFKDPFSLGSGAGFTEVQPVSPSRQAAQSFSTESSGGHTSATTPGVAPAAPAFSSTSSGAAWQAPDSWGVEGDEEEDVDDDESSSSGTEGEWTMHNGDRVATPTGDSGDSQGDTGVPSGAQTPWKARPSRNSIWPIKQRKGESKGPAAELPTGPWWTRIYRADGSYELHAFPINMTVAEMLHALAGVHDGQKASTAMKLYVRERGQDRLMLPSERPMALQARRLQQSGFIEADHMEEIGKEDLGIVCKFIYQTPVLPVMNPDEESSYESFEFIDLSGRDLQVIPIFLHLHADTIIILNVSRNPMTDIPLDFIQACKSLKELRMSNMALKKVPASLRESTTLARLDLSCNRISDLESAQLSDIATLLSLKVQNNRLSSMPSYFVQMTALKYLNISNNVFDEFPSIICEMSNLVDLDVSFNRIARLPAEMVDLRSLERLICIGNELKEFPESFSSMASLRVLDIRRNKLVDLTPVYALPNLATLRADSNDLVTLDTQLGAKVRDFSVPHNSITRFTLAPKPGQTAAYSLTHLNLSHGKLASLEDSALSELINLVELNLSFNQFTRLPQTLCKLLNLEVFSCTDNMVASLPNACFGNMQKLRICNIHNNNLKDIPSDMWLCSSVEVINLSSNLLELLPDPPAEWFEKLNCAERKNAERKMSTVSATTQTSTKSRSVPPAGASLQRLFLGDNRLRDDVFHQISLFSDLKILNVSFNEIYEIPPYTLNRCEKLEALYLSGNKLTSLPADDIEVLQNLRVLHLNGNKLHNLPSELGSLKHLEHLDVGSNVLKYNIANWPYDWNWNWNPALRYLNLSGNKRLEIKPTSGQELSHAAQQFKRELSDFNGLTHLRILGLMDVTLRIPSLPDESDEKRVRTSFSDINNMAYGIADMLGITNHLAMFDLAVPHYRGNPNEALLGMFGRAAPSVPSGKIPKYVQEHVGIIFAEQLRGLQENETPAEALRRTFLWVNKGAFDTLSGMDKRHRDSTGGFLTSNGMRKNHHMHSQLHTGASGALVYLVEKTMHVANAGDTLVVISRKGEAELLGKKHDPTDREETARIRRAEAWVSPKGLVNDDTEIEISRAFGFYQALPAVNPNPETHTRVLQDSDEFIIIGNSALWKSMSYQTGVDIARTERDDPMMAAQKLRDFAISYGAEGSVMAMVVNISDLFFGRSIRGRAMAGAGADDEYVKRAQRSRKTEEVGDRTLNRLQQECEPPVGSVAIVFTDIVNSTALWETNPGMPTAIKMHHNLMRRQLRLDGGYEVKTEGDSFMVSFGSVTAAVLWAFNCQIGLLQLEWPRELLESEDGKVLYDSKGNIIHRGLRVRMGVHWGTPECERDPITRRMDYYGPMVNRAARINASADGGQLMASQDVINVIRELREYIESSDDHSLDELPSDTRREVQEMRRIGGIELKDVGEKKLKGLEVPEKLSLLFPKTLNGRLELFTGLRVNVEVNEQKVYASQQQVDEARQLSALTLRLEALCALQHNLPGDRTGVSSPTLNERPSLAAARKSISGPSLKLTPPNPHLGPTVKDNMTEDELVDVVASLTTRIENCLSTLYLKHLGGFSTVLAALEQATRIDKGLLVHALSLMNGAMGSPTGSQGHLTPVT